LRKAIIIVLLLIAVSFAVVYQASSSNKTLVPYLGKWTGAFNVQRVTKGADSTTDRERSSLHGFVQIYATNRKFKIHLDGEQESLDVAGVWTLKKNRMTLTVTDFVLDDQGGEDMRNPNMKFIPAEELRIGYSRPLVLDLSPDKKKLTGLPITIGNLVGKHEFVKDSF